MILTRSVSDIASLAKPLHLAMGVFDGVHLGHQEVISAAVEEAKVRGELSGVLTFDPFPLQVLCPEKSPDKILASLAHKREILVELGVDFLLVIPFDHHFAQQTAREFLDQLIVGQRLTHISVGEDWKFGKGREGRLDFLKTYCEELGVMLSATAPIMHDGERISSTRIRQAVRDGSLMAASEMLGRPYSLFGKVVEGDRIGRTLGFPTANIDTQNELLPPHGVYVVRSELRGRCVHGVANLGNRPTIQGGLRRSFEVFFFDFSDDIYGEELEVELGQCLRNEKRFSGVEELKEQITRDCTLARRLITQNTAWCTKVG